MLIGDFLLKLSKADDEKESGKISMYYDKVMKAEEILKSYLHATLPRLGIVVRQVALSESTLKRYFKMIFGKSIHSPGTIRKLNNGVDTGGKYSAG